jgi:hypothetical protein
LFLFKVQHSLFNIQNFKRLNVEYQKWRGSPLPAGRQVFPSRTEKLSPPAQMVLQFVGEYVVAFFRKPQLEKAGVFVF